MIENQSDNISNKENDDCNQDNSPEDILSSQNSPTENDELPSPVSYTHLTLPTIYSV